MGRDHITRDGDNRVLAHPTDLVQRISTARNASRSGQIHQGERSMVGQGAGVAKIGREEKSGSTTGARRVRGHRRSPARRPKALRRRSLRRDR
jgi:hypothetical protein